MPFGKILTAVVAIVLAVALFLLSGNPVEVVTGYFVHADHATTRALAIAGAVVFAAFFAWLWVYGWRVSGSTLMRIVVLAMSLVLFASIFYYFFYWSELLKGETVSGSDLGFENHASPTVFETINPWIPLASLMVSTVGTIGSLLVSVTALRRRG